MKWLSAGLTFVNFATVAGLFLGMASGGLGPWVAMFSLLIGVATALAAYLATTDKRVASPVPEPAPTTGTLSKGAQGRRQGTEQPSEPVRTTANYRYLWTWAVAGCFAIFAVRSFCWLLYNDGEDLRIQSPNNLGDLALHITYIKNFANGVSIWPDNPIYVFSRLRYPAGTDLFNALLTCMNVDLTCGLIWAGLLASLATFYALYRWAGAFGVAGFLFNGGVAGFQFFTTFKFFDYQGDKAIAWKSIPLSMFVTQRGLLYAIPAGLLLLWHWREKFFRATPVAGVGDPGAHSDRLQRSRLQPLPFWIKLSLYASMPLFHFHTFMALTIVLLFFFICGDRDLRTDAAMLVGGALLPATFFVWLITDHFQAGSVVAWQPGLLRKVPEFSAPFFDFWSANFGILLPLVVALLVVCGWRAYRSRAWWKFEPFAAVALATIALCIWRISQTGFKWSSGIFFVAALSLLALASWRVFKTGFTWNEKLPEEITFLSPAVAIFVVAVFVKLAPWEWDNLKVMIWAYFLVLPFLWKDLIAKQLFPVRVALCLALFGSGFVSLFGGLAAGKPGYAFADRGEIDFVGAALRRLPVEARFAAFPIYNHPLLLQGRKVVMGYPGHLWTQGFDYTETDKKLSSLMQGEGDWTVTAKQLGVRYIFWGREEIMNYSGSKQPWTKSMNTATSGSWGAIYDLESPRQTNADR